MLGLVAQSCRGLGPTLTMMALVGLIGGGTLLQSGRAWSQGAPATPTGEWRVGAAADDKGTFGFCVAQNRYSSGAILSVIRTAKEIVVLVVAVPGAKFQAGTEIASKLRIDDKISGEGKARLQSPEQIEIVVGPNEQFYQAMRSGSNLYVDAGAAGSFVFALKGTGKALSDLADCSRTKGKSGVTPAAARPPAGGGGGGGGPGAAQMALPERVAKVLSTAGMGAIVPMAAGARSRVWGFGPIVGIVEHVKTDGARTIDALSKEFVAELKKNCKGSFDSDLDSISSVSGGTLQTGSITCDTDSTDVYLALLFHLAANNELFIFSHETVKSNRDNADRARDRVAESFRKGG